MGSLGRVRYGRGRRRRGSNAARGLHPLAPRESLELLEGLLGAKQHQCGRHGRALASPPEVFWQPSPALLRQMATGSEAGASEGTGVDQAFRDELVRSDVETRQAKLRDYFADELARIMGTSKSDLDLEQPLNEVGMDSLLASELKNNLERRLAFNLPMAAFLEGPSITTLAAHAAKALGPEVGRGTATGTRRRTRRRNQRGRRSSDSRRYRREIRSSASIRWAAT